MKRKFASSALLLAMLTLCASVMSPGRAWAEDEKADDIRKLLKLTGAANLGAQAAKQMIVQFRQGMPNVPAEFWDEFEKGINAEELTEMMVPIYAKHLDADDIKELIKFYESPVGRKLSASLPAISQESMQAGQQWGQALAQKVLAKLKEKGINPGQ